MTKICTKSIVKGHVQGVGFRFHTAHEGHKLGLKGYAKNLIDGSVEVVACGTEEQVRALEAWLQDGPKTSRVVSVDSESMEWQHFDGFSIR